MQLLFTPFAVPRRNRNLAPEVRSAALRHSFAPKHARYKGPGPFRPRLLEMAGTNAPGRQRRARCLEIAPPLFGRPRRRKWSTHEPGIRAWRDNCFERGLGRLAA